MKVLLSSIRLKEKFTHSTGPILIKVICGLMIIVSQTSHGQSSLYKTENFIDINGVKIFTKLVGSGTPLLIIHGGPGLSHDYLEPQLIELLAEDYQLIFFDQRASGRSSGVEDTTRITMTQFVEDIESIRKYFRLSKVNVLGHSFGGLIAMYYASTHPNAINKVLLIDSSPASWEPFFPMLNLAISERETEADKEELAKIRSLRPNIQPSTMEKYFKIYFRPFFNNSQLSEDLSLGVTEQWVSNYMVTYPRIMKSLGKHNILDKLSSIIAPTLIIHGKDSVIAVESAQEIANRIPNCRLTILKGVGHFPYIEAPKEFADAIKAFVK
ncbi:alpha/beta fold hydrolase [Aquiflexum sp.]|uniref:alpha/beta fold hydrolase n=1 Tax=Aquiflexum sp. TaxID=1872584 RepID=UPI00359401D9